MFEIFSEMQYLHWLMVAGAVLVLFGIIGFAFRQNKNRPLTESDSANGLKAKK
jgi:hypothetical protein